MSDPHNTILNDSMAGMKKYAGLPDIDLEEEEIYETQIPELTEASTVQETSDDAASVSGHSDFDTTALDPSRARTLFEPSVVDATNVDFSDAITGRRSYRTHRHRRGYEVGPETFQERLARLTREAIELESQLQHQQNNQQGTEDEDENSSYEDTVDQPQQDRTQVSNLKTMLEQIAAKSHTASVKGSVEDEFLRNLEGSTREHTRPDPLPESTIGAIAQFSDRLTALETVLGISTAYPAEAVVPTLATLSTQIDVLFSTLTPRSDKDVGTAYLDPIAGKIRQLVNESERLDKSRKEAAKAFNELLETRDRHANAFHTHFAAHAVSESRTRQTDRASDSGAAIPRTDEVQQQFTNLFLDDQASKIDALYNVLPTIQNLQPLLPTVLERLRALSVIHSSAADVKGDLDDMESKMAVHEDDIKKWRQGVEKAEASMQEGKDTIKSNVQIIGQAVRSLEQRVQELKQT